MLTVLYTVLGVLALVGYIVYAIKDGKKVILAEGAWLRLAEKHLNDNDNDDPEYIRLERAITKSDTTDRYTKLVKYSYFEPDGAVYEKTYFWWGLEYYLPVESKMAKKLEVAYQRRLNQQTNAATKEKKTMKAKALKAFLRSMPPRITAQK